MIHSCERPLSRADQMVRCQELAGHSMLMNLCCSQEGWNAGKTDLMVHTMSLKAQWLRDNLKSGDARGLNKNALFSVTH